MALNWKNVVGQSTAAGTAALEQAGSFFNRAVKSVQAPLEEAQQTLISNSNAKYIFRNESKTSSVTCERRK